MTPDSWKRIEDLFAELADLGTEECAKRLEGIGKTDPELHAELKSLIAAHDEVDELLGGMPTRARCFLGWRFLLVSVSRLVRWAL